MLSPIYSKVLSRLSLLVPSVVLMCFSLTVRAELNVEWIDANTIRVTGYGYGGGVTNDNQLGSCTNCLNISPAEMAAIKLRISDLLIDLETDVRGAFSLAQLIVDRIDDSLGDIQTFRRFNLPNSVNNSAWLPFTNYIFSISNTQTGLVKNNYPNLVSFSVTNIGRSRSGSYNDGIYDYATSVVSPDLSATKADALSILDYEDGVLTKIRTIGSVVSDITEESCSSCGGGTNDCSSCPCKDQWDELLEYVIHIDQDQHKRFDQLNVISNSVFNIDDRMNSYAKLVSGVLYNGSTITLDDGETWTNVYFSGGSNGYDYDKSNILQRIELILFGMAYVPTNTFSDLAYSYTNELDDANVEDVTNKFDYFSSAISNGFDSAYEDFRANVDSLKSIDTMFVFWGQAGAVAPFVLGQVPDLGGSGEYQYITVGNDFLGTEVPRFRMLCRYAFQLLWAVGFLFMIWEFYVRLFKYVVIFLKYVCEWLNECFAS